jgi:hypothetical protein
VNEYQEFDDAIRAAGEAVLDEITPVQWLEMFPGVIWSNNDNYWYQDGYRQQIPELWAWFKYENDDPEFANMCTCHDTASWPNPFIAHNLDLHNSMLRAW